MAFHRIHATITYEQFKLLMKGLRFILREKRRGNVLKLSREARWLERFKLENVKTMFCVGMNDDFTRARSSLETPRKSLREKMMRSLF